MLAKQICAVTGLVLATWLGLAACQQVADEGLVEVTAQPEAQLTPGQSEPGADAIDTVSPLPPATDSAVYTDDQYKFALDYPADFTLRVQSAEQLANLNPAPTAAWMFISPEGLEPPALEVRVYAGRGATSLEAALKEVGLVTPESAALLQPFQTPHIIGAQLCTATLMGPGCAYFIVGKDWVYQLIPAALEGEAMVKTFRLVP